MIRRLMILLLIVGCGIFEDEWTCSRTYANNLDDIISWYGQNYWQLKKEQNFLEYGDSLIFSQTTVKAKDTNEAQHACCMDAIGSYEFGLGICQPEPSNFSPLSFSCSCE